MKPRTHTFVIPAVVLARLALTAEVSSNAVLTLARAILLAFSANEFDPTPIRQPAAIYSQAGRRVPIRVQIDDRELAAVDAALERVNSALERLRVAAAQARASAQTYPRETDLQHAAKAAEGRVRRIGPPNGSLWKRSHIVSAGFVAVMGRNQCAHAFARRLAHMQQPSHEARIDLDGWWGQAYEMRVDVDEWWG